MSRTKAAQVALTVCCFALPTVCLPLALRDNASSLWVRVALPRTSVKRVVAPGGTVALKYALTSDSGAFRSTDDGITWQPANDGLPRDGWGRVVLETLAVAEDAPSIAYAGVGLMDHSNTALRTGLYMTEDAAASWLAVGSDMAGKEVQAIAVMSPAALQGNQLVQNQASVSGAAGTLVVYVATNAGIMRSADGSRSWSRLDWRGFDGRVLCLAIPPRNPNVIYVGTQGLGLYSTWDGGVTWQEMNRGLGNLDINCLTFGPHDPSLMYAATNDGVYQSTSAGAAWTKLQGPVSGGRVTVVTLHPQNANLIYAGMEHGAAYVSADGGEHWTALRKGLGPVTVHSLAIDPGSPETLWAGTTDGVWRYVPELPMPAVATPTARLTPPATIESSAAPEATVSSGIGTAPPTTLAASTAGASSATAAPIPSVTNTLPPSPTPTPNPTSTRSKPVPSRTMTREPPQPAAPAATQAAPMPPKPQPAATATAFPR